MAIAADQGRALRALRPLGAVGALRAVLGMPLHPLWRGWFVPSIAGAREALGPGAAAVEAKGRAMTLDQAVAYALGDEE